MKRHPRRSLGSLSVICTVAVVALSACSTERIHHPYPDTPSDVRITPLGEVMLESRIAEIDAAYAEPRVDYKVAHSFGAAADSISPKNDYAALWRAVRACAWLGLNHPIPSQRWEYAKKGVGFGLVATQRISSHVETHYYMGLCYKALAEARDLPTADHLKKMQYYFGVAAALDGGFDHCAPLRELGSLYEMTAHDEWKGSRVGDRQMAVDLLERACDGCPEFGANQLALARALRLVGQYDRARLALDRVLRTSIPDDYSVEHRDWLHAAQSLREEIALLDDRSVEATAYREDTRIPSDIDVGPSSDIVDTSEFDTSEFDTSEFDTSASLPGDAPASGPTTIESDSGTITINPDGSVRHTELRTDQE
jgi:tetratricopeptide (TPR) repeat protein